MRNRHQFETLVKRADWLQILKYAVHNTAHAYGKTATFMPKPIVGDNGSGMHCHQSVWKDGKNIFAGDGYSGLSDFALYYIGGVIKHAKALNAITNPGTNSYKRLVPGFEAPINLAYSARNRSAAIRIPYVSNPKGRRIEVRYPDPTANPYLAFAAMLMAGLDGAEQDPSRRSDKNLRLEPGGEAASLDEALDHLDGDRAFLTRGRSPRHDRRVHRAKMKRSRASDDDAPGRKRDVLSRNRIATRLASRQRTPGWRKVAPSLPARRYFNTRSHAQSTNGRRAIPKSRRGPTFCVGRRPTRVVATLRKGEGSAASTNRCGWRRHLRRATQSGRFRTSPCRGERRRIDAGDFESADAPASRGSIRNAEGTRRRAPKVLADELAAEESCSRRRAPTRTAPRLLPEERGRREISCPHRASAPIAGGAREEHRGAQEGTRRRQVTTGRSAPACRGREYCNAISATPPAFTSSGRYSS
jgi:hypothetical protein